MCSTFHHYNPAAGTGVHDLLGVFGPSGEPDECGGGMCLHAYTQNDAFNLNSTSEMHIQATVYEISNSNSGEGSGVDVLGDQARGCQWPPKESVPWPLPGFSCWALLPGKHLPPAFPPPATRSFHSAQ